MDLLFDITEEKAGASLFRKFWVVLLSFEIVLRYLLGSFEVVLSFMYFVNLFKQKLPQGCFKRVGGGSRPLLDNVQKKVVFLLLPLPSFWAIQGGGGCLKKYVFFFPHFVDKGVGGGGGGGGG